MAYPKDPKEIEVWKRKISEGMRRAYEEGRAVSPMTDPDIVRKVMRTKKRRGITTSPEHLQKLQDGQARAIAEGRYDTRCSDEHYKKLADAKRGKPRSQEVRDKISQSVSAKWEDGSYDTRKRMEKRPHESRVEWKVRKGLGELGFAYNPAVVLPPEQMVGGRRYFRPDFMHYGLKVVVEINGEGHKLERIKRIDADKETFFKHNGYLTLRFTNADVLANPEAVVAKVKRELRKRKH